jgi:hypothetical protein
MSQRILYKTEEGVAVIIPTDECLQTKTIEQIAQKDVPAGKPYKIVDESVVPSDRTFRGAWTIADSELTDGIGGEHDMFITDPQHPDHVAPIEGEVSE